MAALALALASGTTAPALAASGPEGDSAERAGGPVAAGDTAASGERVRVFLRDGRTYEGALIEKSRRALVVRTDAGETITFPRANVRVLLRLADLRPDRGGPSDPARTHHLAVPSALGLARGEVRVAATGAEPLVVSAGLLDWLAVEGGVSAPLFDGSAEPARAALSAAAHRALLPWLHVQGGLRVTADGGAVAVAYASVTAGSVARHLTLYAGPPLPGAPRLGRFDEVVLAVAGTTRLTRNVGLVAEGWVTPRRVSPELLGALALRLAGARLALDAGGMVTSDEVLAPWVSVSFRFRAWSRS